LGSRANIGFLNPLELMPRINEIEVVGGRVGFGVKSWALVGHGSESCAVHLPMFVALGVNT
jgi:hypothetical protein